MRQFLTWASIIERSQLTEAEKATLKFKAWSRFCTLRNLSSMLREMGRVC